MDNILIFKELEKKFEIKKEKYMELLNKKESIEKKIEENTSKKLICDKSREYIIDKTQVRRNDTEKEIIEIVTNMLQYVRNEDIKFNIKTIPTRGRIENSFNVISIRDGIVTDTDNLEDSRGDGITDLISITLDLIMPEIIKQKGPLILDEPLKQLSALYKDSAANLIKETANLFGRQIIMSTHDDLYSSIGNKKFLFSLKNGSTNIEEIN